MNACTRASSSHALVAAGRAAVARAHLGLEHQRAVVGLGDAQLGHPLRRLPVLHPRIVEPGLDVDRRVVLLRRRCRTGEYDFMYW